MAERRRRAKKNSETDSEEDTEKVKISTTPTDSTTTNATPGPGATEEAENSEYESAEEDQTDEDETDSEEETDDDDDEEDESEDETDDTAAVEGDGGGEYEDDGWVDEERQSGDGQEQPDENRDKLDDDEDRKNPAYVPRKGAFYEHDMRLDDTGSPEKTDAQIETEKKEPEPSSATTKKKLWKEDDKWLHDKYDDGMQSPKSREELIAVYGYDIRAYDHPPENSRRGRRGAGGQRRGKRETRLSDFVDEEGQRQYSGRGYNRGRFGRGRGRRSYTDFKEKHSPNSNTDSTGDIVANDHENYPQLGGGSSEGSGYNNRSERFNNTMNSQQNYKSNNNRNYESHQQQPRSGPGRYQNNERAKSIPRENVAPKITKQWTNSNYRNTDGNNAAAASSGNRNNEQSVKNTSSAATIRETRSASPSGGEVEKKSYSRDRRVRTIGKTRIQDAETSSAATTSSSFNIENKLSQQVDELSIQETDSKTGGATDVEDRSRSKTENQPRSKRYSTQRQRNLAEMNFTPQEQMAYYGTVVSTGTPALPTQPPPHILAQTTATQGGAVIPGQFAPIMGYTPTHYQLVGQMSVPSGPPPGLPAVPLPAVPIPQTQQQTAAQQVIAQGPGQELYHRGGTTYFNPEIQPQISPNRSPVRRPKTAIPIINPQDLKQGVDSGGAGDSNNTIQVPRSPTGSPKITIVSEPVETSV
ncbi:uncharacterized protein LOC141915109 isoform X2 [Tubulanus polymorphus]|uniref:uncharacterized protein LOC141915109 isoform X2 n=1 Tax=Tubulanus polymorphus TaxID=672921 RepID=UPI003DA533E7